MMLRRLGLRKGQNEEDAAGQNGHSSKETSPPPRAVFAPRVDYHMPTRYFKVIYRGSVAVRNNPAEPAPEDGQVTCFKSLCVFLLSVKQSHVSLHLPKVEVPPLHPVWTWGQRGQGSGGVHLINTSL